MSVRGIWCWSWFVCDEKDKTVSVIYSFMRVFLFFLYSPIFIPDCLTDTAWLPFLYTSTTVGHMHSHGHPFIWVQVTRATPFFPATSTNPSEDTEGDEIPLACHGSAAGPPPEGHAWNTSSGWPPGGVLSHQILTSTGSSWHGRTVDLLRFLPGWPISKAEPTHPPEETNPAACIHKLFFRSLPSLWP